MGGRRHISHVLGEHGCNLCVIAKQAIGPFFEMYNWALSKWIFTLFENKENHIKWKKNINWD